MVEKSDASQGIIAALCIELDRQITPNDVICGILEGTEDLSDLSELDELNI